MNDEERIEKAIRGLECCLEIKNICFDNPDCPYNDCEGGDGCMAFMMRDALALLKAGETEKQGRETAYPTWMEWLAANVPGVDVDSAYATTRALCLTRISTDIAEKLGIKPKEGKTNE